MTRAIAASDYETALACQVDISDLEREARLLENQYGVYLKRLALANLR